LHVTAIGKRVENRKNFPIVFLIVNPNLLNLALPIILSTPNTRQFIGIAEYTPAANLVPKSLRQFQVIDLVEKQTAKER